MEKAGSVQPTAVARALEGLTLDVGRLGVAHAATMRAADHQLQQPLIVSVMDRVGSPGVAHDVEGSGYGFRTLARFAAPQAEMASTCRMVRPD